MAKVLIATGDAGEAFEVMYLYYRLREEGHEPHIGSPTKKVLKLVLHDFDPTVETYVELPGYRMQSDIAFADVDPASYDALVITGGRAPEYIRRDKHMQAIARHFFAEQKPVAAICHAPQVLIAAGVIKGRQVAAYEMMEPDITAAGGTYRDEAIVEDGNMVSSRVWGDIAEFSRAMIGQLKSVPA